LRNALFDIQITIQPFAGLRAVKFLHQAAWPANLYRFDPAGAPDSKMHRQHSFGRKARTCFDLSHHCLARDRQTNLSPNRIAVGRQTVSGCLCDSFQFDHHAIAASFHLVQLQSRRRIVVVNYQIEFPVAVEIRDRNSPAVFDTVRPRRSRDIHELAVPNVGEKTFALVTIP